MKDRIISYYQNLSYQRKLKILFNIVIVCVTFLVLVIGGICISVMAGEIYARNQEKLLIATHDIKAELNHIENIITEIHQNKTIQENLISSAEDNKYFGYNGIGSELNWILVDQDNVTNVIILNNDHEYLYGSVYDKNNFFQGKSLKETVELIPEQSKQGIWLFDQNLREGLYIHNIYSTRDNRLKKVGTVLIVVNMSFIQEVFDGTGIFTGEDFFVMEQNGKIYTTNSEKYEESIEFVKENQRNSSRNGYSFCYLNDHNYFMLRTTLQSGSTEFECYYFLLNRQIIKRVIWVAFIFIVVIIGMLILGNRLINRYLEKLISPMNDLAQTMSQFREECDLEKLKNIQISNNAITSRDEIGILYESFDTLIRQIEELVINDYKSKLLNQEMEYKFLQAQLNPHFLYNTLNSMNFMALSRGDTELSEIITSLAFLLRKKLDDKNQFDTIQEEIEIVDAYIKIQKLRFKNRLTFESNVENEAKSCRVPQLIIQPLVENAVKYGVEKVNRPMVIQLKIYLQEEDLYIKVMDNGPGFEKTTGEQSGKSTGIGLKNISKRLQVLYGEKAELSVNSIADEQTVVSIRLPKMDTEQERKS